MGFTKLDSGIIDSSIWDECSDVVKVFIAFWTKSDPSGTVKATQSAMYRTANLLDENKQPRSIEFFNHILEILMAPDLSSRSEGYEGRRIIKTGESEWFIVNYETYRKFNYSDNPDSVRKRIQRENERNGTSRDMSQSVPGHSASDLFSSVSVLGDRGAGEGGVVPTWRTDFKIYEKGVSDAYDALIADFEWMADRQKYHPGLDIRLTMEKAFNDFWGIEAGWKHKKAERSKTIDWKRTFTNALTMRANQVWLKRTPQSR
jgi:hypothetical protein